MIRRTRIHRRTFLRGSLGAGLSVGIGLPLLEAMLNGNGTALAQNQALPLRFGVFFWGNGRGVEADKWTPQGTGATWTPSVELAPLMDVKDYVSVVTGLSARLANSPQGHHDGSVAILSGYDFIAQPANNAPYRSTFAKPSIDQLAAAKLGADSAFKSLEIGISTRIVNGEGTTLQYISHNGPDSANPPEASPKALFDRLFAKPVMADGSKVGEALRALRASVLDTVVDDLNALGKRVSTADRTRLEQHTESIRAIERRLESDPTLANACMQPTAPVDPGGDRNKEPLAERMQAMSDLLAVAMSCDLSRVFSIQFTGSAANPVLWQVGADRGNHDLSHDGAATQDLLQASTVFTMEQFAYLVRKLRDTPDGAGNLLDSFALLATSDHSDGSTHSINDYPVVIAGRAGGALVHPGIHYAGKSEHTNKALLTLLRAVGVDVAELGSDVSHETASLSALET
jgi:hypothetical protein